MNTLLQKATPANVTVQTLDIKKGKPDVRSFTVKTMKSGDDTIFLFNKTMRDFRRLRFKLSEGCIITDDTGKYTCTEIVQVPGKSHFAVAVAHRVA